MTNREWAYHIIWWGPPMPGCRGVGRAGGGGGAGAGGGGAVLNEAKNWFCLSTHASMNIE